jgi:hypothetical protein
MVQETDSRPIILQHTERGGNWLEAGTGAKHAQPKIRLWPMLVTRGSDGQRSSSR